MDETRKLRFITPPIFFIISLYAGLYLSPSIPLTDDVIKNANDPNKPSYTRMKIIKLIYPINQYKNDTRQPTKNDTNAKNSNGTKSNDPYQPITDSDNAENSNETKSNDYIIKIIGLVIAGGLVLFALGAVIGGISILFLRIFFFTYVTFFLNIFTEKKCFIKKGASKKWSERLKKLPKKLYKSFLWILGMLPMVLSIVFILYKIISLSEISIAYENLALFFGSNYLILLIIIVIFFINVFGVCAKSWFWAHYEITQTSKYFKDIKKLLHLPGDANNYYSTVTMDHDFLQKIAPGIHEWANRRWTMFGVYFHSCISFILAYFCLWLLDIKPNRYWSISLWVIGSILFVSAAVAWWQAGRGHYFQSRRSEFITKDVNGWFDQKGQDGPLTHSTKKD
ncbi:MAG: hypothetical protein KAT56_00415 [Sedimentisphaerales bacterium]|nr:hypothetical protein [Sedimentisphaerales bacterium]